MGRYNHQKENINLGCSWCCSRFYHKYRPYGNGGEIRVGDDRVSGQYPSSG
jgi:hypothetical protein